jgi:perosamine synthetase
MVGDAEVEAAAASLRGERLVNGKSVEEFEDEFATQMGNTYGVAVNSGTTALTLALRALGIQPGQYVLLPSATFAATATAVQSVGAIPLFVDIDDWSMTMSVHATERILEEDTEHDIAAMIPVHLYGFPADCAQFRSLANKHDVAILADACQAHGAWFDSKPVAQWADATAWSFHPSKNLTVGGDGGMVTTEHESVDGYVRTRRDCGRSTHDRDRINVLGDTWRLNTVQAAIGRVQLRRLADGNRRRREAAAFYDDAFADQRHLIKLPPRDQQGIRVPVYQSYTVRVQLRDQLKARLEQQGIESGYRYRYPVHRQPVFWRQYGSRYSLPVTDEWANTCLSLPIWAGITQQQQETVVKAVKMWLFDAAASTENPFRQETA